MRGFDGESFSLVTSVYQAGPRSPEPSSRYASRRFSTRSRPVSSSPVLLDATGRRRPPAAMPGHNAGRPPRNNGVNGVRYPADPPTVEGIVAVMRKIPLDRHGPRLRAMIVVLRRGGLRIQEALDLTESDFGARRGSILGRAGKGNKRHEVGMDLWALERPPRPMGRVPHSGALGPLLCVRSDPLAAVVDAGGPRGTAPLRPGGRGQAPPCSPSAPPCSRCRAPPAKACPYP